MRTLPPDQFLAWAAERGIGVDPKWAKDWPQNICFLAAGVERRYWATPERAGRLEHFIGTLLACLGDWSELYLWPKCGGFLDAVLAESALCRCAARLVGPAIHGDDALVFDRSDADLGAMLMYCSASAGWGWAEDLYILTDRRDVVLMVDHHDAVWADFASQERCDRFVGAMKAGGYDPPTEPPDSTFKPSSWMGPPSDR